MGSRSFRVRALLIAVACGGMAVAGCSRGNAELAAGAVGVAGDPGVATEAPPMPTVGALPAVISDDPYCQALAAAGTLTADHARQLDDPAAVQTSVETAEQAFGALRAVAPASISAQWALVGETYGRLFAAYRTAGFDPNALMAGAESATLFEELGSESVVAAAGQIESFTTELCGRPLGIGDAPESIDIGAPAAAAPMSAADASQLGAQLLVRFGIEATAEQQACFGAAITDPLTVAAATDSASPDATVGMERYRRLASGCGIDVSVIGG